jgi:hypothetical protein
MDPKIVEKASTQWGADLTYLSYFLRNALLVALIHQFKILCPFLLETTNLSSHQIHK